MNFVSYRNLNTGDVEPRVCENRLDRLTINRRGMSEKQDREIVRCCFGSLWE